MTDQLHTHNVIRIHLVTGSLRYIMICRRRNTNDMEQTINSTTEVITTSYQGGGPPQPYEAVVMSQTQEADNDKDSDAYYSPVNPNPPQYITHDGDHNASKRRYEVVGGSDTMDSHGYEKVSAEISQRHVRSGGKKEGMNNARAEMENCSLEVPKFRPTKQSDSQYMNVPPSPVVRINYNKLYSYSTYIEV